MLFIPSLRFFSRNAAASAQDPADMGTAFGMEASLALDEDEGLRQHTTEVELESQRAQRLGESPLAWMSPKRN